MTKQLRELLDSFETDRYVYEALHTYRSYVLFGKQYRYDICILSDKEEPGRRVLRFQKRWWGISKAMSRAGATQPRWIIYERYNVDYAKGLPAFTAVFEGIRSGDATLADVSGTSAALSSQLLQFSQMREALAALQKRPRKSASDKAEIQRKQRQIAQLSSRIGKLTEENRTLKLESLRSSTKAHKAALREMKRSLKEHTDDEPCFQRLFSEHKWIFGPWYDEVLPKRKADARNEPDFVLKRYDGFCDIVEIEAPGKELFRKPTKSQKTQPRAELIQAVSQIIDYIDSYNEHFKDEYYRDSAEAGVVNPLNPYRPRGLVIIGRDRRSERKRLRQFNSFLNNISIVTYDEFLATAESMLTMIENE